MKKLIARERQALLRRWNKTIDQVDEEFLNEEVNEYMDDLPVHAKELVDEFLNGEHMTCDVSVANEAFDKEAHKFVQELTKLRDNVEHLIKVQRWLHTYKEEGLTD